MDKWEPLNTGLFLVNTGFQTFRSKTGDSQDSRKANVIEIHTEIWIKYGLKKNLF